jgi:uncharacterized protein (TIGR02996 family)
MATVQGLLNAILDAPDDEAARLVFSDWLEEHGDADRAEFIRVQCELARGVGDEARRESLRLRERELLLAHEREWLGPLVAAVYRAVFVRGFVERVTVHAQRLKKAAALFPTAPIRHLVLLGMEDMAVLRKLPQLRRLTTLDLREDCELSADGVGHIADSPHLGGVSHLILRQRRMDDDPAEALAKTPALARLRTLDLYDAWWNVAPLPLLSHSPHLAGLTTLILGGYELGLGDEAVSSFADPGCRLRSLRRLHLSYSEIGDAGARALAGSPHLASLERLDLTGNPIGRAGRRALRARFGDRVRW